MWPGSVLGCGGFIGSGAYYVVYALACVCLCRLLPWQLHGERPPGSEEEVPLSGYRSAQLHAVELVRSTTPTHT